MEGKEVCTLEIKKGTWRIAILIPKLNIAIKLPRIYLKTAYKMALSRIKYKGFSRLMWKEIFEFGVYSPETILARLFKGIAENFGEFVFYLSTRHVFLLPTYFSVFGLINVQKLAIEPKINDRDLLYQMATLTYDKANGHHYRNPANFSYQNGKLQILDYGDPRVQRVVKEFGKILQEKFDINAKCPHNGIISGLRK